jgi:hypothetical protein
MTDIATLTRAEEIALADCEERIERGLKTFIEVGSALAVIRDSKLYRESYETFEAYAKERWNLSRPRAYELMTAAEVVSGMPDTEVPVENARQAVELAKVPEPERAGVWRETVERTAGKPTAAAVREVSEEQRKRADEQRDARALLQRIVDLVAPPSWSVADFEVWIKQLGPYDEEMSGLVGRATEAIAILDRVIGEVGQ